jgi:uncharacterized protein DUF4260
MIATGARRAPAWNGAAEGVVVGAPRRWLRLEALALMLGSLVAYGVVGESWWLLLVVFLAPDLSMAAYALGLRAGTRVYNLAHTTLFPALTLGAAYWQSEKFVASLALIWLAHIALDRLLGFGLKYDDHAGHTHLGGKASREP